MVTENQQPVIDVLSSPLTHGGADVHRIDTHSAIVFLAGSRAYKLKRAVRFDYLDFSTAERRRTLCEAEVRLNRRAAPSLYRGVVAVTREADASLRLGGSGPAVDWVIEMRRFAEDAVLDRLAAAGRLEPGLMPALAAAMAAWHAGAEPRADHGGRAGMAWVIDGNADGFAEFGSACFDAAARVRLVEASRAELDRQGPLLDARRDAGLVRQCHGDLHLRNIVLMDGAPVLFDGVEFNDEISCIDVMYDAAFLLMDLWRRRLPLHANAVLNHYLAETGDAEALALLPLFLSCRAAVRAKTSATAAHLQEDPARRGALQDQAREYFAMAAGLLHPPSPCLIAVGGLSGSGKSTLARRLAPALGAVPGARVLRSDEVRKRLCGVPPLAPLGPEGYTPEVSGRVYAALAADAAQVLRTGHSAIVDAVHARPADRQAIARVAAEAAVPFAGLWLEAPEPTLIARVEQRRDDVSDADADVVRKQRSQETDGTAEAAWQRLDASAPIDVVLGRAMAVLRSRVPRHLNGALRD